MADPPKKKPSTYQSFRMDSADFPTFKVNVPALAKSVAASPPKAQVSMAKPKGSA